MLSNLKSLFGLKDPTFQRFQQQAEEFTLMTPDYAELQAQYAHNVFVYNENQSNGSRFDELKAPRFYRGQGFTESSDFVMYKTLLGLETFPIALEVTEDQRHGLSSLIGDPGQIIGEVYSVRYNSIVSLDNYMLNGVRFTRKRVKVVIPFRIEGTDHFDKKVTEVFMYVGKYDFWKDYLFKNEAKKTFARSERLFATKEDDLGAHYLFDYKLEVASR